uniref:Chitin-binding type-2 domain-containing protein n=1 Tax=Anopheles farauti TaxID=69004 RepID=A0A182QHE0_9DIPT
MWARLVLEQSKWVVLRVWGLETKRYWKIFRAFPVPVNDCRLTRRGMPRRSVAACMGNCHFVFFTLFVLMTGAEVRGDVGKAATGNSVRTVKDLMELMLNRDILDMLRNGGFDFREPARIFLPPKFYSIVPLDQGQPNSEQAISFILPARPKMTGESLSPTRSPSSSSSSSAAPSYGGKADQQKPSGASGKPHAAGTPGLTGETGGTRINLISYSDGKVTATTTTGAGDGGQSAVSNKGSETLEKNVGTNVNAVPAGTVETRAIFPAPSRTQTTPANERHSLTTSITDQTVSQNVGRTLPPTDGRVGATGGSTKDRLRSALPGEPDVDYPILGTVPATQFRCDQRHQGYYADVETRCQVFRVCANTDSSGRGFAFLCPNGTLFNQRHLVCDWYMNVRCEDSESFYHVNEEIGKMAGGRQEMMAAVMSMVTYPMRTLMETMAGVGVIDVRVAGVEKEQDAIPVPPVTNAVDFGALRTDLQPPFSSVISGNGRKPIRNELDRSNYVAPAAQRTKVDPVQEQVPTNVYRPKLNDVYVSNLGTLSTDVDSGFDPQRSTLLTKAEGTVTQLPQVQSYGAVNQNRKTPSQLVATDVQLVRADLVKSWDGQPNDSPPQRPVSLKLTPIASPYQKPASPTTTSQPAVERFVPKVQQQKPKAFFQGASILPPTGVLPPSSFTRTVSIGGTKKVETPKPPNPPAGFAPLRKVLSVQKVTVVPENVNYHTVPSFQTYAPANFHHNQRVHQQSFGSSHTGYSTYTIPTVQSFPSTLYTVPGTTYVPVKAAHRYISTTPERSTQQVYAVNPAYLQQYSGSSGTTSRVSYATVPQQHLRRSDIVAPVDTRRSKTTTTVLQVVPSLSFYLNDAQEKRAFDEAVRQGLFDERRRRAYTSYDVPLGSVGRLSTSY